jgi:sRNA-binding carbon storage regulator CsrA
MATAERKGGLVLKRLAQGKAVVLQGPGGERVEVRVLDAGRGWARLHIAAPPNVSIWREELEDKQPPQPPPQ